MRARARHSFLLLIGIICSVLSATFGSYDGGYGSTLDLDDHDHYEPSYPAPSIVHNPHHNHGHSAGSYYHYHVPLVGQQQHYQPYHQDHSHYLWPLLLLLALPLLFLPLLPLLLLPLGISLLALLAPGGMMMMMMMMMMGGMMPMMRTDTVSGRALNEMRTFGDVLLKDIMTSLLTKYARSLDLDQCPQRAACEIGAIFFPQYNTTDVGTAKAFTNYVMDQYIPKGRVKKAIKQFERAFWSGSSNLGSCSVYHCQPSFRIYKKSAQDPEEQKVVVADITGTTASQLNASHSSDSKYTNGEPYNKSVNYIYANSKANVILSNSITEDEKFIPPTADTLTKVKSKRSHFNNHYRFGPPTQRKVGDERSTPHIKEKVHFNMFGTPIVKS